MTLHQSAHLAANFIMPSVASYLEAQHLQADLPMCREAAVARQGRVKGRDSVLLVHRQVFTQLVELKRFNVRECAALRRKPGYQAGFAECCEPPSATQKHVRFPPGSGFCEGVLSR